MTTEPRSCDCFDRCGDDPAVLSGRAYVCSRMKTWQERARLVGVSRVEGEPNTLAVHYNKRPSDDDLRALHVDHRCPP